MRFFISFLLLKFRLIFAALFLKENFQNRLLFYDTEKAEKSSHRFLISLYPVLAKMSRKKLK